MMEMMLENKEITIEDFYQSIIENDYEKLYQLLDSGGNVNLKDESGWTPLMYATKNNDSQAVEILLINGADIDALNDKKQTALMIAAYYNAEAAGNELIMHGANMAYRDKYGKTAYVIAHEKYDFSNNDYFLKHDIDIKQKGSYFCNRYLSKIKTGDIINLRTLSELYEKNYAYSINAILFGIIKDYISKTYDIEILNENEIKIIPKTPTSSEIYSFIKEHICNHKIGSSVFIYEIEEDFKQKFNISLPAIDWNEYINKLKYDNIEVRLCKDDTGCYLLILSNKYMLLILLENFFSEQIGAIIQLSDIKEHLKKSYGVYIMDYQLSKYIYEFESKNVIIKPRLEGGFHVRPTEKKVKEFIYYYFLNFNLGEVVNKSDLFRDFKIKYHYKLTEIEFKMFLNKLPFDNYTLIVHENNEYCIAPSMGKIDSFFKNYFKNAKIGDMVNLPEIKDKYEKKFHYSISDNDFFNIFNSVKLENFVFKKTDNGDIFLDKPIKYNSYSNSSSNDLFYHCIGNKRYYN